MLYGVIWGKMSSGRIIDLRKGLQSEVKPRPTAPTPWEPQKRISPIRVRRRRTRIIMSVLALILVACAAYGVSYASYLPQYTIQSISVSGAQTVPPSLISDYVKLIIYNGARHFLSRGNIFLYPRALIEKDVVAEFPRLSSAHVSRESLFANAITVTVTERQPYALWCDGAGGCYQIDQTGFIFAVASSNATSTSNGQYLFSGSISGLNDPIGQTFAPGHMPGIVVFLQLLGQAGFTPEGATIQSNEDFAVPLAQGFSVYASFGEDATTLVNNLQLVLSSSPLQGQQQNLEYVDLRFGNRVYYKLKGQGQVQTSTSGA
jgi:cell division septal protein FtsQ